MYKLNGHINQYLANLIIHEQFLVEDKNNLRKYKKIYSMSKMQIFLKDSPILQQLTPSIEIKINSINNQR